MTVATRLLVAGGGSTSFAAPFPGTWGVDREATNPVIAVAGGEAFEQYDPAPFRMAGDDYALVKGGARIYLYKATGGVLPFVGQNGGSEVIGPGAGGSWNSSYSLEPAALYDSAANVIRAWYKGSNGSTLGWGYATAPGATPTVFTPDAGNPILTASAIETQMGGTVGDTAPFDVIYDGTDYHFYGYVERNSIYQIVHMTGTAWNDPDVSTLTALLVPPSSATLAATGSVFRVAGRSPQYGMFYTWGPVVGSGRTIRVGKSADLVTWDFSDTTDIISPATGWEAYHVYTPRVLRATTVPYLDPILDGSNRWTLYYSGADASWVHSQTGLAYLSPS